MNLTTAFSIVTLIVVALNLIGLSLFLRYEVLHLLKVVLIVLLIIIAVPLAIVALPFLPFILFEMAARQGDVDGTNSLLIVILAELFLISTLSALFFR